MHRKVFEIVFLSIKQSKAIKTIPGLFYWGGEGECIGEAFFYFIISTI